MNRPSLHGRARCRLKAWLVLALLATAAPALAQGPYEGFATTPGGSGGAVVRVTNLNNSGPGSLRAALAGGNRTIVFDVGGEIVLSDYLRVGGAFVTIDGATAPPPGITLKNRGLIIHGRSGAHDVIVSTIRVRNSAIDGIQIAYGAYNVVIDHVSIYGSRDGGLDITEDAHDVTVSWTLLIEPASGKTMLIKYGAKRVTLHHNFFLKGTGRNPSASVDNRGTPDDGTTLDMRNNLVWDWGYGFGTQIHNGAKANAVNNFYSSPSSLLQLDRDQAMIIDTATAQAHTSGNVSADFLTIDLNALGNVDTPFDAPAVTTEDACVAASGVFAGAGVRPLDAIDEQHLTQVALPPCGPVTPTLDSLPQAVEFTGTASGFVSGPKRLTLTDLSWHALPWTATLEDLPWLSISPTTGTTRGTLTLTPSFLGLSPGALTGAIVFESAEASNSPYRVPVTLNILPGPQTVRVPVVTGLDDATQRGTAAARTGERLVKIGRGYLVGLRFANVPLARGAEIQSVVLKTYSPNAATAAVKLRYYGEATDNSLPITETIAALSRRPSTVNTVDETPGRWLPKTYNATADLTAIIQEIVDRPGWVPGNAITLFIADHGSASSRSIASFETLAFGAEAAVLEITVR